MIGCQSVAIQALLMLLLQLAASPSVSHGQLTEQDDQQPQPRTIYHPVWIDPNSTIALLPDDICCEHSYFHIPEDVVLPKRMAFILGAQKSGTTYLFDELTKRHPNIIARTAVSEAKQYMLGTKEAHYFDQIPIYGLKHFAERYAKAGDLLNSSLTFMDGTPSYLMIPSAACRIKAVFPDARFIVLLRDPVSRALSQWNMGYLWGGKKTAFNRLVHDEMKELQGHNCTFQPPCKKDQCPWSMDYLFNLQPDAASKDPFSIFTRPLKRMVSRFLPQATGRNAARHHITSQFATRNASHPLLQAANDKTSADNEAVAGSVTALADDDIRTVSGKTLLEEPDGQHRPRAEIALSWRRADGIQSWNSCFKCSFTCKQGLHWTGPGDDVQHYCGKLFSSQALVRRGLYVYQLEWWLKLFKPEQFLIINHEEMKKHPEAVLDRAISFLGQSISLKHPAGHVVQQRGATKLRSNQPGKDGQVNKGNLVIARSKDGLNHAFLAKNSSGWSLPLKDADALTKYAHTLEELYKFYSHPNKELYRLMEALGPSSGWTGKFPARMAEGKSFPTIA
ncbi:hypothetical protein CEUSTIGMA_g4481.t1 [Chlamydomonas eustigma]|uniref:Sulfotransferase n=1 Tax=Chlamydomonas eustigma TaxID=1157962 RepID=A0A250X1R2_9CHLO|nr:hypothetical protein CEUSTIGMA_g4481.t1 [Chlamydomonas eustigma]|eukprot:GAX77034.1 hypothetical protein CEUSTIGMA_g4481.t1 [Chlamydomonas eustigma]